MNYLMIGSISGCMVIIIGAFGAHAFNELLDDYGKSIYNKAVLYHMFHSIALLILGLLNKIQPEISLFIVGLSFLFGIILFSGSLYILAITGIKPLGMITPIGGILFIIGWVLLVFKV